MAYSTALLAGLAGRSVRHGTYRALYLAATAAHASSSSRARITSRASGQLPWATTDPSSASPQPSNPREITVAMHRSTSGSLVGTAITARSSGSVMGAAAAAGAISPSRV